MKTFNIGDTIKVSYIKGVAFSVVGYGSTAIFEEDCDLAYYEPDYERLKVCMIGDDRIQEVDADSCAILPEEEYCAGCGQIGCCAP